MSSTNACLPQAQEIELPHTFEEVRAERAKRSLREYVKEAWRVVEPATPFVSGWHLEAICEHLEAITSGEIRNLLINVPPRHMKSLAVSVFWPTWEWITNPHLRYIYSAYGQDLSIRDALKSRRVILSPWYQKHYGDAYQLTSDQNQKTRYDNDKTGYRIATGVGGMATGEGGDRLILDDPHKLADRHSDAAREEAIRFWNETMSTRGNDPKTVAKVVIMQRVHERDVSGDILEKMDAGGEPYETLILPAEYQPSAQMYISSMGWKDPRKEEGELLWPERFDRRSIEALKVDLGDSASGQLQQSPAPAGGAIFKREWWLNPESRYDPDSGNIKNRVRRRYVSWDTAYKDKDDSAYTAAATFEVLEDDYTVILRDVWREKLEYPALQDAVTAHTMQWNQDGLLRAVVIEDKASGISLLQTLALGADLNLRRLIIPFSPGQTSKDERARQAAYWCRLGLVKLPEPKESASWLFTFTEEELYKIPVSRHRDQADAFAQGIIFLEEILSEKLHSTQRSA